MKQKRAEILIITTVIFTTSVFSQSENFVSGNNYQGYIFPEDHNELIGVDNQRGTFTPLPKEIAGIESKLRNCISKLNKDIPNQGKGCPKIRKSILDKYIRQYFGFIDNNGNKIIIINFVWEKGLGANKIDTKLVSVLDGCTRYWNIKYNMTSYRFFDIEVNVRS